jgi:hypothetical protein
VVVNLGLPGRTLSTYTQLSGSPICLYLDPLRSCMRGAPESLPTPATTLRLVQRPRVWCLVSPYVFLYKPLLRSCLYLLCTRTGCLESMLPVRADLVILEQHEHMTHHDTMLFNVRGEDNSGV